MSSLNLPNISVMNRSMMISRCENIYCTQIPSLNSSAGVNKFSRSPVSSDAKDMVSMYIPEDIFTSVYVQVHCST